jgi:predicted acetyltransferase
MPYGCYRIFHVFTVFKALLFANKSIGLFLVLQIIDEKNAFKEQNSIPLPLLQNEITEYSDTYRNENTPTHPLLFVATLRRK